MKHILRVPTKKQYAYIEAEFEGTADDAVVAYNELTRAVLGGTGLGTKEFNDILDTYMVVGSIANGVEVWEKMDERQKWLFQELKKSKKRLADKA